MRPFLALLLLALSAGPALAKGTIRILVIDLKANGVEPSVAQTISDTLTATLAGSTPEAIVLGQEDIRSLIKTSMQQQLLGCEDPKCLVDVGQFVGADFTINGSIGKVGEKLVVNIAKLDVAKAAVAERWSKQFGKPEDVVKELPAAARHLVGVGGEGAKKQAGVPVVRLKTHDDAHMVAVQYVQDRKRKIKRPKTYYRAGFRSTKFDFGEYDQLNEFLPLKEYVLFMGKYHSCLPRDQPYKDAFSIKEERPMGIKVPRLVMEQIREMQKRRKLKLYLTFQIEGAKLYPLQAFDWKMCEGVTKPFKGSEIAPNAWIKVVAGYAKDKFHKKKYPLSRTFMNAESGEVEFTQLPLK